MAAVMRRLLRAVGVAARALSGGKAHGGALPAYQPRTDERPLVLSPGGPDYARIARLERELGIGDAEPEPERPMRRGPKVCLTKNCGGSTGEYYTWSGVLIARIHQCG